MDTGTGRDAESALTPDERALLADLRAASSLADLQSLFDVDDEHEAYFAAKREWTDLHERRRHTDEGDGLPGDAVTIDGTTFHVHGITHADTDEEGRFLRRHVSQFVDAGHAVLCEQGIRPMYFSDFPAVSAMDDYRWATARCRDRGLDSSVSSMLPPGFDSLADDIESLTSEFRRATFSLIEAGSDVYGDVFAAALGDLASDFLTGYEGMATGAEYESFTKSRRAARNPAELVHLQRYYRAAFLPQPVEREWLRRHDPKLELVTHARNERLADYAVYHADDAETVHLVVGAAHQPGVVYYLERFRDGERRLDGFELAD
ncbi:hypothetical protein [Haloarchaeobius sp. HRN-SO-5]|uniref:hypothetical protein n=1 Tax=Haloarchaeobius sp. HRN-SO-5 TaxID=3446118 RepID=UPI003EB789B7